MKKGDVIINPYVSALIDGKPNPCYAMVFVKALEKGKIKTLKIDGKLSDFFLGDKEWKIIGNVDFNVMKAISPFVTEWSMEK